MDPELLRLIQQDTPQLNPRLATGFATEQLRYAEKYLDDVVRSAARGFPEGLQYLGWKRCTPEEEYNQAICKRNFRRGLRKSARTSFETSESYVYLVKYRFSYNGEELPPWYVYLPYTTQAGQIMLSGSKFNISPVLADRVISIGADDVFVRFLRDRLTFKRLSYGFKANGLLEKIDVVYSLVHKGGDSAKSRKTVSAKTTMVHYLFCKFGVMEAFQRYAYCTPVIAEKINPIEYPPDQWIICSTNSTIHNKPKGFSKIGGNKIWETPKIEIAIRKEDWSHMTKAMIGCFFYIVDHFPDLVTMDTVINTKFPTRQWMILLGHILFSGNMATGKLYDKIANHMESLDEYVDMITRSKMHDIGVEVDNFYDFIALIVDKFNEWLLSGADKINSMYDKELSVNYYVLFGNITDVFNFYFAVKNASKKGLDKETIRNLMSKYLRSGSVFKLRSGHGEVTPHSYSGDNMVFKITSTLIPQSSSTRPGGKGKKGGDRSAIEDPSKRLHVSVAEIGAYSGMRKSDPSGRSQVNLHARIDHKGLVLRNPDLVELLDSVQMRLKEFY